MLNPMEKLQPILLFVLNHDIDSLVPRLRAEGVINLRTAKIQWCLQVAEVVILQKGRMREATNLASPVCERVADVWRSKAVANTGVLGVGLAVHFFDFLGPLWDLLLGEGCVLVLPGFEVEAFLWLSVVVAV